MGPRGVHGVQKDSRSILRGLMVRSPRQKPAPESPGVEGSFSKGSDPPHHAQYFGRKSVGNTLVGAKLRKLKRISESSWDQHTTSILEPGDLDLSVTCLWGRFQYLTTFSFSKYIEKARTWGTR